MWVLYYTDDKNDPDMFARDTSTGNIYKRTEYGSGHLTAFKNEMSLLKWHPYINTRVETKKKPDWIPVLRDPDYEDPEREDPSN